jgi:2-methylaconitate cis-trans-isomerase PrpF
VTFSVAEIAIEFLDLGGGDDAEDGSTMFPTGHITDLLDVPGVGKVEATFINAGIPTVFVEATALGLPDFTYWRYLNKLTH